jgi:hypothetical protein
VKSDPKANSLCSNAAIGFKDRLAVFQTNTLEQEVKVQWAFSD